MKRLKLRLHHLMCCYTFTGVGYDNGFSANMRHITALLYGEEPAELTLVQECDDICAACPHKVNGMCDTEESIQKRDAEVAVYFGKEAGQTTENRVLVQELLPRWKRLKRIDEVCRTCAFTELCNRVLAEKNRETAAPKERET